MVVAFKRLAFALAAILSSFLILPALCFLTESLIPGKWFDYGKGIVNTGGQYGAVLFLLASLVILTIFICGAWWLFKKIKKGEGRAKVFTANVAGIVLVLLCFEARLRYTGHAPGMYYQGFERIDTIVDIHVNTCDQLGVNHYDTGYVFGEGRKINADGFLSRYDYSRPIIDSIRKSGKKIIMVVGDSFVEGVSSSGWNNSFMELLRKKPSGYELLNFGIGGMDPVQYKLVTDEFLSGIKPDLLVVICCDNDIMNRDRIITPGIPLYYSASNNGLYSQAAIADGLDNAQVFKTFDEAYRYYFYVNYKVATGNLFFRYISRSSAATLVVTKLQRRFCYSYHHAEGLNGITNKYLVAINQLSAANNIPCIFLLIPGISHTDGYGNWLQQVAKPEFRGLENKTYFFTEAKLEDYIGYQNQHFNDRGNEKFAAVLDSLIMCKQGMNEPMSKPKD